MKLYIMGIGMLLAFGQLKAQYIERFNNILFSPNSTWSSSLPTGMTNVNLDGLQAASQIAPAFPNNEAWVTRINENDTFAVSHSWYTPSGTSNDWLITPAIYIPVPTATETPFLIWKAKAPDINFPDGYMVKVSTNGNQPISFLPNPIFQENAAPNEFLPRAISLANFGGQTIHLAFINNSTDKFMLYVDDIEVKMLPIQPDIALVHGVANRIAKTGEDVYLNGTIVNHSAVTVYDATITWSNGINSYDMLVSGLNISPMQSFDFVHDIPFNSGIVDENLLNLTVSSINNLPDVNPLNNSKALRISTVSKDVPKAVVFEEVTGTWCGWCPRGIVSMQYMDSLYAATGEFIGISIHTQDTMALDDYADSTGIHLIPRTNIDRTLFDQETNITAYQQYFDEQYSLPAPAAIFATALYQNQQVGIQVNANFETKISSGLRFAVILVEDSVHSEHSSFDQVNLYHYYGSQNPMGGFENLPDPIPAAQMWYNHVARALIGGYHGQANSVSPIVYEGNTESYHFYYTLPPYVNAANTKAVVMLIDEETGRIYNAKSFPLMYGSVATTSPTQMALSVFPNPASQELKVTFENTNTQPVEIALYNTTGEKVKSVNMPTSLGTNTLSFALEGIASGTYLMGISMEGKSFWQHVIIIR